MTRTLSVICTAVITSLAVLAGACCLQAASGTPRENPAVHEHQDASASNGSPHGNATEYEMHGAALTIRPEIPQAGQRAHLAFTLTDGSGQPIEELVMHHARKLHVLIVSEDMHVLGHVHPRDFGESIEHGEGRVSFRFPRAGRYVVAANFMTDRGSHAGPFIVEVAGPGKPARLQDGAAVPPSVRLVKLDEDDRYTQPILLGGAEGADGYTVSLQKPDEIRAGEPVSLVYRFDRNAAPVTDLRPYLAAPLHLAVVKDDITQFLHEHGTASTLAHSGHSGHAAHEGQVPTTFGPEVAATVSFPEPGIYYLFAQAAHGEMLLTSRFSIEVR